MKPPQRNPSVLLHIYQHQTLRQLQSNEITTKKPVPPITYITTPNLGTTSKPINETTTKKPVRPSNLPTFLVKQILKILKTHIFNFAKTVHPEVEKNAALVQKLENLVKDHAQEIVDHQQHPDAFSSRGLMGLITKTTKIAFRLVEKAARLVVSVVKNTAKAVVTKTMDVFKSETAKKIVKDVVDTGVQEMTKKAADETSSNTYSPLF
ncbi:hypothetical protein M8J76_008773 [Diaphorina citri]|nr:hypothetical protein M8J75_004851 [Diaphorina citri]KAI5716563.1 hypothetical protein M8J76_008773 [Diaphorina citri]